MHKNGGAGTSLIDAPATLKTIDPAVSADGRYIYYSARNGAWNYNAMLPQYSIGVYDREKGTTRTIASRYGSAFTPVLSKDGKWLVYGSRYEDKTGLVKRNLANLKSISLNNGSIQPVILSQNNNIATGLVNTLFQINYS